MRFLVSGASGFVGSYLTAFLAAEGHQVVRLVRRQPAGGGEVEWDPAAGQLSPAAFESIDVVINLSGASIAGKRWSDAYKRELIDSRVGPTSLLARTLAELPQPPAAFVSVSGAGWYGQQPPELELTEQSGPGTGFIAALARQWEDAASPAAAAGIRVIHPRLGSVISRGGMLARLATLFRAGLGARLGSGRQVLSWIALDDIGPALLHCLAHNLAGPVNFTAPEPVTNAQFTALLAAALHRPAWFAVPAPALRLVVGELAGELLAGQNVMPKRLTDSDYRFRFPTLREALAHYVSISKNTVRTG